MSLVVIAPATAHDRSQAPVSHARIVQEQSHLDAPDATKRNIGWSRLVHTEDGYSAAVFARGLNPGGVYTFWWVSPYEFSTDGTLSSPVVSSWQGVRVAWSEPTEQHGYRCRQRPVSLALLASGH